MLMGLPFSLGGGGVSSLLYISIAYYMQKGGGWVQIACKIAYVLNGRPLIGKLASLNIKRQFAVWPIIAKLCLLYL